MLTVGDRALILGTRCVVEVQKITRQDCIVKAGEGRTFSISRAELAQLPYLTNDFWWAAKLLPYYDPISEHGLARATGDKLYRLSEAIPLEERKRIPIYPRVSFHTYVTGGIASTVRRGTRWKIGVWSGGSSAKEDKPNG